MGVWAKIRHCGKTIVSFNGVGNAGDAWYCGLTAQEGEAGLSAKWKTAPFMDYNWFTDKQKFEASPASRAEAPAGLAVPPVHGTRRA